MIQSLLNYSDSRGIRPDFFDMLLCRGKIKKFFLDIRKIWHDNIPAHCSPSFHRVLISQELRERR